MRSIRFYGPSVSFSLGLYRLGTLVPHSQGCLAIEGDPMKTYHLITAVIGTFIIALAVWSGLIFGSMWFGCESLQAGRLRGRRRLLPDGRTVSPLDKWRPDFGQGTVPSRPGQKSTEEFPSWKKPSRRSRRQRSSRAGSGARILRMPRSCQPLPWLRCGGPRRKTQRSHSNLPEPQPERHQ